MSCNRAKYSTIEKSWQQPDKKENYFVSYAIRGPIMFPSQYDSEPGKTLPYSEYHQMC